MSSSVFKEQPVADSATPKSDNNLVVFLNKNGSVSVDHLALQDLLGKLTEESCRKVSINISICFYSFS